MVTSEIRMRGARERSNQRRKKPKQDVSNDVGAPENRINMSLKGYVLTPRLPQFITPVLEPEIIRFGRHILPWSAARTPENFAFSTVAAV